MTALYRPGIGMIVTLSNGFEGLTITLPEHMSVWAIEHHLRELVEYLA